MGKHVPNGEGWVLKVIYGTYIHPLFELLVGQTYTWRLKADEHGLLLDMMKIQIKVTNIFLTLKENNVDNVTKIK